MQVRTYALSYAQYYMYQRRFVLQYHCNVCAAQCNTLSVEQYSAVWYSVEQYSVVQCSIYSTVQYSAVQYNVVQYSVVQYSIYSTVQYSAV